MTICPRPILRMVTFCASGRVKGEVGLRTHPDYEPQRRKPMTGWGCIAWLLLSLASLSLATISVLFVGSLVAHVTSWQSPAIMLAVGLACAFIPAMILNSSFTWIRQRWNKRARFKDTFAHVMLLFNTLGLLALVVLAPALTSQALKQSGHWPFSKEVATFLQVSEQHVAFRRGRQFVKRIAYLLEMESENPTLVLSKRFLKRQLKPKTSRTPPPDQVNTQPDNSPEARRPTATPPVERQIERRPPPAETKPPQREAIPLGRRILQPLRSFLSRNTPPIFRKSPRFIPPLRPEKLPQLKPARPNNVGPAKTIRLSFEKQGSSLIIPVELMHAKSKLLLDTGASFLTLSSHRVNQLRIRVPHNAPSPTLQTANGRVRAPVGLLSQLTLGGYTLRNVAFVVCNACADRQRGLSGLLGLNVLRRFLFTLDHEKGQILLHPQPQRKNRAADIKPFVKYTDLFGRTTQMLLRRTFRLKGRVKNYAKWGLKKLKFRVVYLKNGRTVAKRHFSMSPMRSGQSRTFSFKDTRPPHFGKYRVELLYGEWDTKPPIAIFE